MDTGAMGSLLWFIIIGALFYFVMRKGGCGMGHSHGGHSQHGEHGQGGHSQHGGGLEAGKTKDPVCGMEVKMTDSAVSRRHMGQIFYFCSSNCMEKFDKDPETYISST